MTVTFVLLCFCNAVKRWSRTILNILLTSFDRSAGGKYRPASLGNGTDLAAAVGEVAGNILPVETSHSVIIRYEKRRRCMHAHYTLRYLLILVHMRTHQRTYLCTAVCIRRTHLRNQIDHFVHRLIPFFLRKWVAMYWDICSVEGVYHLTFLFLLGNNMTVTNERISTVHQVGATRSTTIFMVNTWEKRNRSAHLHFLSSFLVTGLGGRFTTAFPPEQFVKSHARNGDEVQRDGYGMVVSVRLLHDSELEAPLRQSVVLSVATKHKRSGYARGIIIIENVLINLEQRENTGITDTTYGWRNPMHPIKLELPPRPDRR